MSRHNHRAIALSIGFAAALALAIPASANQYLNPNGSISPGYVPEINSAAGFTQANPGYIQGSFTANLGGFHPESSLTPITASTIGVTSSAFTAGKAIVASNKDASNDAYCFLGGSASTSSLPVKAGQSVLFQSTTETTITCATGSSTAVINLQVGTGLFTGVGGSGAGGGGGGTVTQGPAGAAAWLVASPNGNLALETGGNLATLAGGVSASVYQSNEKQINGVAPLMGNGVSGTGSQRVNIASDNTAFTVNPASATAPIVTMNSANAAAGVTSANAAVFDDVAPTSITENNFGYVRMSANRNQYQTIRDAAGNERGVNVNASNQLAIAGPVTVVSGGIASGAYASGAYASGSIGAGAQVDLLTMRQTVSNGAAASNSLLAGLVYHLAPLTLTDGQGSSLQGDAAGRLIVNCASGCGGSGGTSIADAGTFTQTTTSLTPIGGIYTTSVTNLTTGQAGVVRLTNDRKMMVDQPNSEVAVGGAAAPTFGVVGAAVYNSSPITVTATQAAALQSDINGYLNVHVQAALGLSAGSTTSGQTGSMIMGAVTTAAPGYTTAQTNYLSLTTAGGLRTDMSSIAGTTVDTNSGNLSAGTQRVVLATNQPTMSNPQPVTPQAGELHVGEVGGNQIKVDVAQTVTASAYSPGNSIGALMTVSGAARVSGTSGNSGTGGILSGLMLDSKSVQSTQVDIFIFDANPTGSTCTDKSAFVLAAADAAKVVGVLTIPSTAANGAGWFSGGTGSLGIPVYYPITYSLASSTTLYGCAVARGAFTPASTSDVNFKWNLLRN